MPPRSRCSGSPASTARSAPGRRSGRSRWSPTRAGAPRSTSRSSRSAASRARARSRSGRASRPSSARASVRRPKDARTSAAATTGSGVVRADAAAVADHDQTVVQDGPVGDGLLTPVGGAARAGRAARGRGRGDHPGRSRDGQRDGARPVCRDGSRRRPPGGGAGRGAQRRRRLADRGAVGAGRPARRRSLRHEPDGLVDRGGGEQRRRGREPVARAAGGRPVDERCSRARPPGARPGTVVVQTALASSRSDGGIGGVARTTNCSTVQQGAAQGIGAPVSMGAFDLTAFCPPPAEAPASASAAGDEGAPLGDPTSLATAPIASSSPSSPPRLRLSTRSRRRGTAPGAGLPALPSRARLDHSSFERARVRSGYRPRGAPPLTRFRLRPSASAPRHAPGGLRGAEGRRQGVAAPCDG